MNRLADLILVLHLLYVLFVVLGLAFIWLGAWRGWRWVRNRWFRALHLAAIGLVALESAIGMACPMTTLEDWLRGASTSERGFVQRWLQNLLYWDWPAWLFAALYVGCFALIALTFLLIPVRAKPVPG